MLDALLIAFLLLQVYDCYSTNEVLRRKIGYESNPVIRYLMDRVGIVGTLIAKTALALAAGAWMYVHDQTEILAALTAFYGYFMYQNYKVLNGRK